MHARIIEPASKQASLRVLAEAGAPAPSYPTLNRRVSACILTAEDPIPPDLHEILALIK